VIRYCIDCSPMPSMRHTNFRLAFVSQSAAVATACRTRAGCRVQTICSNVEIVLKLTKSEQNAARMCQAYRINFPRWPICTAISAHPIWLAIFSSHFLFGKRQCINTECTMWNIIGLNSISLDNHSDRGSSFRDQFWLSQFPFFFFTSML